VSLIETVIFCDHKYDRCFWSFQCFSLFCAVTNMTGTYVYLDMYILNLYQSQKQLSIFVHVIRTQNWFLIQLYAVTNVTVNFFCWLHDCWIPGQGNNCNWNFLQLLTSVTNIIATFQHFITETELTQMMMQSWIHLQNKPQWPHFTLYMQKHHQRTVIFIVVNFLQSHIWLDEIW